MERQRRSEAPEWDADLPAQSQRWDRDSPTIGRLAQGSIVILSCEGIGVIGHALLGQPAVLGRKLAIEGTVDCGIPGWQRCRARSRPERVDEAGYVLELTFAEGLDFMNQQLANCHACDCSAARPLLRLTIRVASSQLPCAPHILPEISANFRKRSACSGVSAPSVSRHDQLWCSAPGRFIRPSVPRSRMSWTGTITVSATDV